ncbi:LOW QUALITY PROTEIN: uncharacterized protein LJ206_000161 [Theristicus caerulescens]
MTSLEALITNIELCSKVDGCSTVTFPTLKKLSVNDVVTIWSSVSKHVRQQLLQTKPHAVSITGLGTFHIQKWLSFENGEVLTFQRPRFSLSGTVARIRELRRASVPVPGEMKKVSVSYKKIHSDVPYSKEVVQNCMQETLNFFYFILTNRGDVDFVLEDVGTLAIRGKEVTMAFCQDFLLSLNKSTCVVEKLLTKKWVISDKEVALAPSSFGRVYRFPQFEMRAVPRRASLADQEILAEFESALSSMGIRAAVRHTLLRLRRGLPPNRLGRAGMEEEAEEETEGTGPQGRLLPQCAGTEGRQHKETPFESPELPSPTSEERRQTGEVRDMDGRLLRHLIVDLPCKSRRHVIFAPPVARPASPFLKPTRATDLCHLSALQLPQEEEDGLSSLETTCGTEEGLQTAEAWSQARRQFRRELESLGDIEKWLAHKPSLSSQEERCWERIKARRAERTAAVQSAVTDSPDNKDSPIEWKEKCRLVRSGDGPVDEHCLPSTVEADLGELVDRYRRNAVVSYLKSSELCQELSVAITDPTLQKALLHPGDKIIKAGEGIRKIRQPGGYYSTGPADAPSPGSPSRPGTAPGSQAKEAENRFVQRGLQISPLLLPRCGSPLCAQSPRCQRQYQGTERTLRMPQGSSKRPWRGRSSSRLHGRSRVLAKSLGCRGEQFVVPGRSPAG